MVSLLAYIWMGNPTVVLEVDAEAVVAVDAVVQSVTVGYCDGSEAVVPVGEPLVDGKVMVVVPGGDVCGIAAAFQGALHVAQVDGEAFVGEGATVQLSSAQGGVVDLDDAVIVGDWVGPVPSLSVSVVP